MRCRSFAVAAVASAVLPAAALAAVTPMTSVVTSNATGPSATFAEVSTDSDCGGRLVSGGGTRLAQSTPTVQHNGIRMYASTPGAGALAASADGDAGPTRWLSAGGSGGAVPNDAQTLGYALCLDAGPPATQVVVASTPGPAGTYEQRQATATCPAGTRLLSGGAQTTPGTVGSLKPIGSFPSDAAGRPLTAGADPASWTVVGLNGGGGDQGNATHAFALCAVGPEPPNVAIVHARVPGPTAATSAGQASASCPPGSQLLGGGGYISDAFGLPGSQGDHLSGSYPSDDAGTAVAAGGASAWTAASHTGGADSGALTQTDVWAMCATAADAAPPAVGAQPGAAAARPSNSARPAIAGSPRRGRTLTARRGTWTNAPTALDHDWLRCASAGNACVAIAGAHDATYRLALADAGTRMRVRETARNAAGAGPAAVSSATGFVSAGRVTAAQIRVQLLHGLAPSGRGASAATLLARATIALEFRSLRSGRAAVAWRHAQTVVARGTRAFAGARATTLTIRLTPAGRRALRGARPLRLTATASFTPPGGRAVRATTSFAVAP